MTWLNISTIRSIESIHFYINQTFFYVDKMLTLKDYMHHGCKLIENLVAKMQGHQN